MPKRNLWWLNPRQNDEITSALPGERESERLFRLVKAATEDLRTIMEEAAGALRPLFAQPRSIGQHTQASLSALTQKIQVPRLHLPEIKLPDVSGQVAATDTRN